jgi:hypothetical protein
MDADKQDAINIFLGTFRPEQGSPIMSSKKAKTKNEASSSRGGIGGESIVADCGRNKSTCGYCKSSTRFSISHGSLHCL